MIPTVFLSEAEVELWEAVEYYETQSPGLGLDFEAEVEAAVQILAHFPERCPLRKDGTRRYLTHRFPYLVIYLYHEDQIWIIAIAHCKRKPGYWTERVKTAEEKHSIPDQ